MGLSIYKSDINTISDNINIINYKQKNIENVINTINNSINTLKANCYGTTVSVMCFKLNNLKQQIESINEYLTKYKQESQQVVDLYYQHCDGLNLDEDTLRNNISILNNKIDRYNNLSKPNKRLVNNATSQLDRNQELLDGLYYVSDTTSGMMQVSSLDQASTQQSDSQLNTPYAAYKMFEHILFKGSAYLNELLEIASLKEIFSSSRELINGLMKDIDNTSFLNVGNSMKYFRILGWAGAAITIYDDWKSVDVNNPKSIREAIVNTTIDVVNDVSVVSAGAWIGQTVIPIPFVGALVGGALALGATNFLKFGGKSVVDWAKTGVNWLCDWRESVMSNGQNYL